MIRKSRLNFTRPAIIIVVMCSFMIMAHPPLPARAGGGDPQLPRRNPPPAQQPANSNDRDNDGPVGAYIELQTQSVPLEAWTVIQWQDTAGTWHDVAGWQGTLEPVGNKRWWVAAKDFGRGPFRWLVRQGQTGHKLTVSTPFNLPTTAYEIVLRQISLGQ